MANNYKGQCRTISLYPEYWEKVDELARKRAGNGRPNVSDAIRHMIDNADAVEELDKCIRACFTKKISPDEAIQLLASIRFRDL